MQSLDFEDFVARSFSQPKGCDILSRQLLSSYLLSSEIPIVEFLQLSDDQKCVIIAPLFNFLLNRYAPLGTLSFLVTPQSGSTLLIGTGD
jgi:hypothetical protein